MKREHNDVLMAREFMAQEVWYAASAAELKALVERNALKGSPLGQDRFLAMRDLQHAVDEYLRKREVARLEFSLVDEATND